MSTRQYIGARYVPKFYDYNGSPNWRSGVEYESLTIVTRNGNSYTSKKPVPSDIGEPENNPEYWVATGMYNEQLEEYRRLVEDYKEEVTPFLEEGGINEFNLADGCVTFEKLNETVAEVIFMPVSYTTDLLNSDGDCTVIRSLKSGKTVMIDSGASRCYSGILSELNKRNITHIDYFILTHYHDDHFDNVPTLVRDNFIDSETIAYLPRYDGTETVSENFNRDKIITPNNTTTLNVDDVRITFFNCSSEDYAYYDSQGISDQNNRSVCNYVTVGGCTILFTGDIHRQAQNYLCESGRIKHCEILKVPHHGNDIENSTSFFLQCSPRYGVVSSNIYKYQIGASAASSDALVGVATAGGETYCCGNGAIVCGFRMNDYTLISNGVPVREYKPTNYTLFVDSTYTAVESDGSQTKPFKSLKEAIAFASKANVLGIIIKARSSYTSEEEIFISSCRPFLTIDGFTIKSLNVKNSRFSFINGGITGGASCVNTDACIGELNNVTITEGNTTGTGGTGRALRFYRSIVEITGCTISNKSFAICGYWGSSIDVYNTSGTGNDVVLLANGCHIYTNALNFPDQLMYSNDKNFISGSYNSYDRMIMTYDGGTVNHTIDLSDNAKYSRRLLLLSVQGGGLYMITRWGGSAVLNVINKSQYDVTVSVTDLTLNISSATLESIVFSLQYLN